MAGLKQRIFTPTAELLFVTMVIFSAFWYVKMTTIESTLEDRTEKTLLLYGMLTLIFLRTLFSQKRKYSWKLGVGIALFLPIVLPTINQTDQYRYVWDGLSHFWGINPYALAPSEYDQYGKWFWTEAINHPNLNTIYGPIAQLLFALSALMNPFFWNETIGLNSDFVPLAVNYWQVEFGWKLLVGVSTGGLFYFLRTSRWDLLLLHPLFVCKWMSNVHVDAMLSVFLLVGLLLVVRFKKILIGIVLILGAMLMKWWPLIYGPLVIVFLRKHRSDRCRQKIFAAFCIIGMVFCGYYISADGKMFESLGIYSRNWVFYGYIYGLTADILYWAGLERYDQLARLILLGLSGCFIAIVIKVYFRSLISLRLGMCAVTAVLFAFLPTLHPWYFLTLLALGMPYFRVLPSTWLWPWLAFMGQVFYLGLEDNAALRYLVYCIVSLFLARDAKRIHAMIQRRRNFEAVH